MKVPLRFQITEFDCGTTALTNAISYLYEREEIPAELIKKIFDYTLDCKSKNEDSSQSGTSREAMQYLVKLINDYSGTKKFQIKCRYCEKVEVTLDLIRDSIKEKDVVLLRTYQNGEHYVIVTNVDEENVYIFDSYYLDEQYHGKERLVEIVFDYPFKYNRIVNIKRFDAQTIKDFSLGPIEKRECVLISRK